MPTEFPSNCQPKSDSNPSNGSRVSGIKGKGTARDEESENSEFQLVHAKLGIVSALFAALDAKHSPTAAHSLRVSIGMSNWGLALGMPEKELELIEVVGLLHDIGKISVPDSILRKPSELNSDEQMVVDIHPRVGVDLLRSAGASKEVLGCVANVGTSFNALIKKNESPIIKLTSQMLAIMDAFDSMTTEQVYRATFSRDHALAELFKYGGTQFNPKLVRSFADSMMRSSTDHDLRIQERWLKRVRSANHLLFDSGFASPSPNQMQGSLLLLLQKRLLDAMREAVIFIDLSNRIHEWNKAAEKLTGVAKSAVDQKEWNPQIIMLGEEFQLFTHENCPIRKTFETGLQTYHRLNLRHSNGQLQHFDANIIPVYDERRNLCGAAMLMQDATDQISMEENIVSLNERVTQDALTKVHNRAELNRQLPEFVEQHIHKSQSGSLIICDIDFFKKINDTFGHPAGDEALVVFASILKQMSRESDLVVRYGGEEFVILCPECDIALATDKAEAIRAELQHRPLPSLRSTCITASFGVTEVQPGDTGDTLLARADRALLMAKGNGRNRVVQMGGMKEIDQEFPKNSFSLLRWLGFSQTDAILETELITTVPLDIAIEKLRGFIDDHKAEILTTENEKVALKIDCRHSPIQQRSGDRPSSFFVHVHLIEVALILNDARSQTQLRTLIELKIRPVKQRDRRTHGLVAQAEQLRNSFQSYLGAVRLDGNTRQRLLDAHTKEALC